MPYRGILNPQQLAILTAARDDYCRKAGVQEGTPEHEDAGPLVLALFHQGATTAEALAAALENRLQSEGSVVLPNGDTTDNAYAAQPDSGSKQLRNAMRRFIFTAMGIAAATAANAHDWYEDKIDPQTQFKCCGGFDCRAVPRSSVQSRTDGGYTYLPHNFTIPSDRVQESEDDQYHICEDTYVVTNQTYWRCFFAPRVKVSTFLPR